MLTDQFGRTHNYLRISLTDNCNLRCFYCMPEENYDFTPHSKLMQVEEIDTLAKLFVQHGVNKIRLTGGEPFVRKDAAKIIHNLGKLPVQLTGTTNGIRIDDMLSEIVSADFHSINISLDTLHSDKFLKITRRNYFDRVMSNIDLLLTHNIKTKINVVLMKGINDDEICDFIEFTKNNNVEVRFIEFMPFTGNRWTSNQVMTQKEILEIIATKYDFKPLPIGIHDTAKSFSVSGHQGNFAIISTMSEPFCSGCNRIRLTADGKLKNCLFSKKETDLLTPLREKQDILPIIHSAIWSKAKTQGGQLNEKFEKIEASVIQNRSMINIGG
ncbi:GTP 3',8-cyclase MoaA [Chryseobacterium culicis]|uniref:GTP 3',8-cyclase n=1 Tax=Chryseobacterium culicis TaxID=680127 RepID=A0A1H6IGX0_CHRCI|nr:GTP 3',8-cyclase MoaA [Chryseobacterium culicis]SEH47753.1 cyclic pyranopterin monophosphate synthase subunit MoaA [Chryseobacterium culicis]